MFVLMELCITCPSVKFLLEDTELLLKSSQEGNLNIDLGLPGADKLWCQLSGRGLLPGHALLCTALFPLRIIEIKCLLIML